MKKVPSFPGGAWERELFESLGKWVCKELKLDINRILMD